MNTEQLTGHRIFSEILNGLIGVNTGRKICELKGRLGSILFVNVKYCDPHESGDLVSAKNTQLLLAFN